VRECARMSGRKIVSTVVQIYMTIVIWLVFIPSYFTTVRAVQQRTLVSLALLLNATNILLCLYVAKIYALLRGLGANKQHKTSIKTQVCH